MRIINYQVCSHTGYMPSSKHFSHTACNTSNPYCVLPLLSFFLCAPFLKIFTEFITVFLLFYVLGLGCEAWDLSLLTRDLNLSSLVLRKVLTSGPLGKPIFHCFNHDTHRYIHFSPVTHLLKILEVSHCLGVIFCLLRTIYNFR